MGSKEFIEKCKEIVKQYAIEHLDKSDNIPEFDVFDVWYCKTLQNHKALLSTTLFDGMYYECTYNGDKKELFDFGQAIKYLKDGKRVQRQGWNGKNRYIELATNSSYKNTNNETINAEHEAIGNKAIAFVGTSGVQSGWLASQADMLAEDWRLVELGE